MAVAGLRNEPRQIGRSCELVGWAHRASSTNRFRGRPLLLDGLSEVLDASLCRSINSCKELTAINDTLPIFINSISPEEINSYSLVRPMPSMAAAVGIRTDTTLIGGNRSVRLTGHAGAFRRNGLSGVSAPPWPEGCLGPFTIYELSALVRCVRKLILRRSTIPTVESKAFNISFHNQTRT
jgi:hypothetical protein